jgi:hypothetical protein
MTASPLTTRRLTLLRTILALAGFGVALLAVALEDRRLGWAAIALLIASLIVRLIQRRPKSD